MLRKVRLEQKKGDSLVVPVTDSESGALDSPWVDCAEKHPGTSGPDTSDGSWGIVSSSLQEVKTIDTDSSDDEGHAIEKAIDELPPANPPRFEPFLTKKGVPRLHVLASPYPGLKVDDVTFRLLQRMEEQDVVELLRPVSDIEDNAASLCRVVERYWISCINIRHKASVKSPGNIMGQGRSFKLGTYGPDRKLPSVPPSHGWTCSKCGAPRAWDDSIPSPCILRSALNPPFKGEAGSITLDICVPGGTEKWILTFRENKPAWVILGNEQPPSTSSGSLTGVSGHSGTSGPDDASKSLSLLSDQLKLSSAEPVGHLATEAPVDPAGASDLQFSDFVDKNDRGLHLNSHFDDEEARQSLKEQGIEVPDYDPGQESVAFHPDLINTKLPWSLAPTQ